MGAQAWPDEKSARAFALRLDGLTFSQIAQEMGVSRSAVSGYLSRHGVTPAEARLVHGRKRGPKERPSGTYDYEVPKRRTNDDRLHLTLMLAAMREARAA